MSVVRLEWLRLWRTYRLVVLVAVFGVFGVLGPLTAAFLPEIISLASQSEELGALVDPPEPTPPDGIAQYIGNISQLGLIAVAAVAALALAVDARPGLAAFYRTRQPAARSWILPRWAATTLAAAGAWTIGLVAAAIGTALLIGPLPLAGVVAGWAAWLVYLAFVVAVVALAAGVVRSTVAVTVVSVALLIVLALVGLIPVVGEWLPSHLVAAPTALAGQVGDAADYLPAGGVSVVVTGALLWLAARLARRREL